MKVRHRLTASFWHRLGPVVARRRRVTYAGASRSYCSAAYNRSWMNERAIEIPIASIFLDQVTGRGLEVGNVMSHYCEVSHEVVDKYEQAPDVQNVDVLDVAGAYDFILAVSTIEHVGFDEPEKDDTKAIRAIHHLRSLLRPGGRLLVTAPLGYNRWLDVAILNGELDPATEVFFDRGDSVMRWRQMDRRPTHANRGPGRYERLGLRRLWVAEWRG